MRKTNRTPPPRAVGLDLPEASRRLHVAFSPPFLDISRKDRRAKLLLTLPKGPGVDSVVLGIDAYLLDAPVHPEGHYGWWLFDIAPDREYLFDLSFQGDTLVVASPDMSPASSWTAPGGIAGEATASILLHLVLRHKVNNSILSQQSLVLYRSAEVLQHDMAVARAYLGETGADHTSIAHGFNFPKDVTVHLVSQALPRAGQIVGQPTAVMAARRLLRNSISCRLYASEFDPWLRPCVSGTRELLDGIKDKDILVLFYDGYEGNLSWLHQLSCRKAFVYLGLPSTEHLQAFDAEAHHNYTQAFRHMGEALKFDLVVAASRKLTAQLAFGLAAPEEEKKQPVDVLTICPWDRRSMWGHIEAIEGISALGSPFLLCPAPLEPNNDFLASLALFEKVAERCPGTVLAAAGTRPRQVYYQYVEYMLSSRYRDIRDRVHLWMDISDGELKHCMQQCDGLIQMGALPEECVEDAKIFGKPLFVNGVTCAGRPGVEHTFRLYGTLEDQAEAVLGVLEQPMSGTPMADGANGHKMQNGLWEILERLVALPVSTRHP